jgi:hypothetical protein
MNKLPEEKDEMFVTKQIIKLTGYLEDIMTAQKELETQEDDDDNN